MDAETQPRANGGSATRERREEDEMKIYALVMAAVLSAGCIDCEMIFCPKDDPGSGSAVETGMDTGGIDTDTVEDLQAGLVQNCWDVGTGWACLCDETHPCDTCPSDDVCFYVLIGNDSDIRCEHEKRCQLLCNPLDEPGCHFDECDGELLDCSRYGYSCDYWCPNT